VIGMNKGPIIVKLQTAAAALAEAEKKAKKK
jgi:hypothetical protein